MNKTETASDYARISEYFFYLRWGCVSYNIKIFRFVSDNQISDSPAYDVGSKVCILQAVNNLQGIRIDVVV